ncbi:MAG: hypothetical protein ACPLKQ_03845 [Candidatus Bathyarchaeales archaeon]
MKVTALKEHKCFCCGGTINKGDVCFAFIVNPENPQKSEFDVIYTCLKCSSEESCQIKVRAKSAPS